MLRAVVDEGKKAGVMVQVHAVSTPAMMAAVDAGVPLLVHLPNKDFTSKEDAKKLAASGTKVLATIGFGAPVFGVFADDNLPRFRDGKPWPRVDRRRRAAGRRGRLHAGQRAHGVGRRRHPRLLHRHHLRPEGRARARAEVVQHDVLHEGHGEDHGTQHGVVHPDGRPARLARSRQDRRHRAARRRPARGLLELAEGQGRDQGRQSSRGQAQRRHPSAAK